jgi:hypothetical protein
VQYMLAQAKRSPHHYGIKKGGLLKSKLTPDELEAKGLSQPPLLKIGA